MEHGQPVDKLILCNLEEMLIILKSMEVDHNPLVQLYIGDLIFLQINIKKLTKIIIIQPNYHKIIIHLVFTGPKTNFIPILIMIIIRFYK